MIVRIACSKAGPADPRKTRICPVNTSRLTRNRILNEIADGLWTVDGQLGSNPQVLINAVTGQVESWYCMYGNATCRDLAMAHQGNRIETPKP
jgi:hypothetical protein